jgi:hypothetical protein
MSFWRRKALPRSMADARAMIAELAELRGRAETQAATIRELSAELAGARADQVLRIIHERGLAPVEPWVELMVENLITCQVLKYVVALDGSGQDIDLSGASPDKGPLRLRISGTNVLGRAGR